MEKKIFETCTRIIYNWEIHFINLLEYNIENNRSEVKMYRHKKKKKP